MRVYSPKYIGFISSWTGARRDVCYGTATLALHASDIRLRIRRIVALTDRARMTQARYSLAVKATASYEAQLKALDDLAGIPLHTVTVHYL